MLRKNALHLPLLVLSLLVVLIKPVKVNGAWPDSPETGVPVCTAEGTQEHPRITTDGAAGAIIVWQDEFSTSSDIYAQRLDARGEVKWTKDGVAICLEKGSQRFPNLVSDGSGGAVIVWWDQRTGSMDIYAQRVNGNGEVMWQPGGVPVCAAPGFQQDFDVTTDGNGGAIVAWQDYRSPANAPDVYIQRIDANGRTRWQQDGIVISRQRGYQSDPCITSDGFGGAIAAWNDWDSEGCDIRAQRVNANGEIMWQENGVLICGAPQNQCFADVASDGSGGAIIAWMDSRAGTNLMDLEVGWDIYAQRVSAQSELMWQMDGVPICRAQRDQYDHTIIDDSAGGAFITWHDQRSGNWDIYAQKLDASGNIQWAEDGLPVCIEDDDQYNPDMVGDGAKGVIITWWDKRYFYADIYAQRIDADGNILWTDGGTAVCTAEGRQQDSYLVSSGVGGAIITWWDIRRVDADIYAQRIISE